MIDICAVPLRRRLPSDDCRKSLRRCFGARASGSGRASAPNGSWIQEAHTTSCQEFELEAFFDVEDARRRGRSMETIARQLGGFEARIQASAADQRRRRPGPVSSSTHRKPPFVSSVISSTRIKSSPACHPSKHFHAGCGRTAPEQRFLRTGLLHQASYWSHWLRKRVRRALVLNGELQR
jgi:hypothetical protein